MRLFKLLVIVIIIGSLYLYARQNTDSANNTGSGDNKTSEWQTITTASGVSLQFPRQPLAKSFDKFIDTIGRTHLTTYQSSRGDHVFIMLWVTLQENKIQHRKIGELEQAIHTINDTQQLTISHKQAFVLQSYYGLEYKARHPDGTILWCRTVNKDNQLISTIYASHDQNEDKQLRDRFFQSLRLQR